MTDETNATTDPAGAVSAAMATAGASLEKFLATADVTRAYGAPVAHGDTLIIPTAEVLTVLGFGIGAGGGEGTGPAPTGKDAPAAEPTGSGSGTGGGGGGGGRTLARPVAVIIAGPGGVRVEPVVDPTKIALGAITAAGFMATMLIGFMRPRRALRQITRGE
jgi:uncharacterized spore protein YtfJ